ncbi:hypothetical protein GCM10019059_43400 [Camelimonas fluminis]|nr:hypothetical protein GCM10019059_43400 [Camelimonas fluminis]
MSAVPYLLAFIAVLLLVALGLLAKIQKRLEAISGQMSVAGEVVVPQLEYKLFDSLDRLHTRLDSIETNTYKTRPDVG